MEPGRSGLFHRLPSLVNGVALGVGQGTDDRPPHLPGDEAHRLQVPRGAYGEAGLDDIHPQGIKLPGYLQLLLGVEHSPRRLLPVPQSGVKNNNPLHWKPLSGQALSQGIRARRRPPTCSMGWACSRRRRAEKLGWPAWFSVIHSRAKVPSWTSFKICLMVSFTRSSITRGPRL